MKTALAGWRRGISRDGYAAPETHRILRQKRKGKAVKFSDRALLTRRLNEIYQLINYRHGGLSDTVDVGLYLYIVAQTIHGRMSRARHIGETDLVKAVLDWCIDTKMEVNPDEIYKVARSVVEKPLRLSAATIGKKLRVTVDERHRLAITTFRAKGQDIAALKAQRAERKRKRERARRNAKREAGGGLSRAEYLARSATATAPWKLEGISRRTWERRREKRQR